MLKIIASENLVKCNILRQFARNCTTTTKSINTNNSEISEFRCNENNPSKHTASNFGQYYQIPNEIKKTLFQHGGLPKSFETQVKTFTECCLMIRNPGLNLINYLKQINYQKPAIRFVIYGKKGTGKSLTLAHVIHYAAENNFVIVHVPWVSNWMRRCKEYANSTTKEGYVDLPIDAAAWLVHFRTQNLKLLTTLKTTREYVWSKREVTPQGSPLSDLVEHGVNRVKFASDCVVAIAEQLKILSTEGKCKTLVAIDGFNAFFYPHTRVYRDKKPVPPEKVRLTDAFMDLTKNDWCNGVVVLTVDEQAVPKSSQGSHYPFHLLGKRGFEHLDPFVPISVNDYSPKEFDNCIKYYRDRLWIQTKGDPAAQNEELNFLSGLNPYKLMEICAPL